MLNAVLFIGVFLALALLVRFFVIKDLRNTG